jgi:hypothetical protein
VIAALLVAGGARPAAAQEAWPGRVEVGVGVAIGTGADLGRSTATLVANQGPTGGGFTLFEAGSRARRATSFAARVAWRFGSRLLVEGRGAYSRPEIVTTVSNDPEAASLTFTGDRLVSYALDGSVVLHMRREGFRGRAMPYLIGGGGYLRELHGARTIVETGTTAHVGGGLKWLFSVRQARTIEGLGIRIEGRGTSRTGGVDLGASGRRTVGSLDGSFLVLF